MYYIQPLSNKNALIDTIFSKNKLIPNLGRNSSFCSVFRRIFSSTNLIKIEILAKILYFG